MTPQIPDVPVPETFRFGYGDTTLGTIWSPRVRMASLLSLSAMIARSC